MTTPSGKLVVEEEWEEARWRKLPVRVFVQEGVERDTEVGPASAGATTLNGPCLVRDIALLSHSLQRQGSLNL